jgi:hypothetical protein
MLFYHKGLGVRKTPLPLVAGARKAAILRGQIWSAHESDVVGLRYWAVRDSDGSLICLCVYKRGAMEVLRRLQATEKERA